MPTGLLADHYRNYKSGLQNKENWPIVECRCEINNIILYTINSVTDRPMYCDFSFGNKIPEW